MKPNQFQGAANVNARPAKKMIESAKDVIVLKSWRKPRVRRTFDRLMTSTDVLLTTGYAA